MSEHELKVSVSGSDVYKAVANYIKNSPEMQQEIRDKVAAFLTSDVLMQSVHRRLENEIFSGYRRDDALRLVKNAAETQVEKLLTHSVLEDAIKRTVSNFLTKLNNIGT